MKPKSGNKPKSKHSIRGLGFGISGQSEMLPETFDMLVGGTLLWKGKAQDLMNSAQILWSINYKKFSEQVLGASFPVAWMLAGFALENAFKAIIIPSLEIKKSGDLPKEIREHDLVKLAEMAKIAVDSNERAMLAYLTEFVMAYGRYPVHTNHKKMLQNFSTFSDPAEIFKTMWSIWTKVNRP